MSFAVAHFPATPLPCRTTTPLRGWWYGRSIAVLAVPLPYLCRTSVRQVRQTAFVRGELALGGDPGQARKGSRRHC